ncbi:hypothetical protein F5883DRAFT_49526 [Diaporthe sp. PMI_573]|nr:hypothetical protein F5883DRAFT_49526 [Diaporthaceae sp. PMI_573]
MIFLSKHYAIPMETRKLSPSNLRKGHLYCVWSFARRAERWFEEELSRQAKLQEPRTASRRRQPSRAAKDKFKTGDYTLSTNLVDPAITRAITSSTVDGTSFRHHSETSTELGVERPDLALGHFRTRLSRLIWTKAEELKSQDNMHCICTLAGKDLDCVDGGDCGHGLVNQCMRWIPRVRKQQIRCEMVDFFSSEAGDHYFRHLPAQKKAKGVTLKNETLRRLQRLESADGRGAMPEAEMRESPVLGGWPGTGGFLRENNAQQRAELLGLAFLVDGCLGNLHILMV